MFNEEHRDKLVFEDFGFDATDEDELKRREAETIQLIKDGKLPEKNIDGQVMVNLVNFENLTRVEGKPVCMYKFKVPYYTPEGTVAFQKDMIGFMVKNFNWEEGVMNCRIPVDKLTQQNMHLQGDTFLLKLFMVEKPESVFIKTGTYVGEVRIKWKHCLDEDKMNNWQHQQVALVDPEGIAPKTGGVLSC